MPTTLTRSNRRHPAAWLTLLLFLLGSGCAGSTIRELQSELGMLRAILQTHERTLARIEAEQARQAGVTERKEREQWSERLCKAGKLSGQIAEFINQVQEQVPSACSTVSMESALTFMKTQPYAIGWVGAGASVRTLHTGRREYLIDFVAAKTVHPSTRFLVMVQPSEENRAAADDALRIGQELVGLMRQLSDSTTRLQIIGPHPLPCQLRPETKKLFTSAIDQAMPAEPQDSAPRVRVFVFKSEC